jgi:hypothetical protein
MTQKSVSRSMRQTYGLRDTELVGLVASMSTKPKVLCALYTFQLASLSSANLIGPNYDLLSKNSAVCWSSLDYLDYLYMIFLHKEVSSVSVHGEEHILWLTITNLASFFQRETV